MNIEEQMEKLIDLSFKLMSFSQKLDETKATEIAMERMEVRKNIEYMMERYSTYIEALDTAVLPFVEGKIFPDKLQEFFLQTEIDAKDIR